MTITVFCIYIIIIVFKLIRLACVVRWIDIDYVNFSCVGIAQGGEGFKVITLNKNMVRGIVSITHDGTLFYLAEYGKLVAQTFLHIFRLVLPNETILFLMVKHLDKCRLLLIGQPFELAYLVFQFYFIHVY